MRALSILFLVVGGGAAGCVGAPDEAGPVGEHTPAGGLMQHTDGLDAVRPEVEPDQDRAALAAELWCPACVTEGLRARLEHDVRFHVSGTSGVVLVEIDGALACAGPASGTGLEMGELYAEVESGGGGGGGGEDEGNPDPEPALDDLLPPSPAPPPSVAREHEDEGNPDPEPALGDHLPTPTPGPVEPGGLGS
jgi:hypothetical protein